jgi:hypothetical protein
MGPQPAARAAGLTNPVMRSFQSVLSRLAAAENELPTPAGARSP